MVDKNGFLLEIMITVANVYDGKAVELLMRTLSYFLSPVKVFSLMAVTKEGSIEAVKKKIWGSY